MTWRRYRSLLVRIAWIAAVAIAVSGCSGSAAAPEILAKSRTPLHGEAVDEYAPPILHGPLAKAVSVFGLDLIQELAGETGNVVISPFSAYSALGLAQGAADGETLDGMKSTLKTSGLAGAQVDAMYADMLAQLRFRVKDTPATLDIANSVWLSKDMDVEQAFLDRDTGYYGAQVARLDMTSGEAPDVINSWVRENTGGEIEKLVDRIDPRTAAVLCNAVYFKDAWWTPFKKSETKPRDFRLADGTSVEVPTMAGAADGSFIDNDAFQAVALPTKSGSQFWIFVPKGDRQPRDVLARLQQMYAAGSTLGSIADSEMGSIYLPKFDIAWKGSLKEPLAGLGMARAFDEEKAEFPHLTPSAERVWISEVVQAATTAIDEKGFEAAAATEVGMVTAGAATEPFELHVDRPFVYAIMMGDVPLFMGVVNDPRE